MNHPGEKFDGAPFVDRRCKHPIEDIQAAVDVAVSHEQAVKLTECLSHIDEIRAHKKSAEEEIQRLAGPYSHRLSLLRTVPGFSADPMTAMTVIAEIGANMSVFPSAKHLAAWAGCCPRNDRGSFKIRSTRIFRAGSFLKPLLVQIANAVIRSDKHPEFSSLKARRGHKKAVIAICRMFLTAIRNILSRLGPYSPDGFLTEKVTAHSVIITKSQGLALLRMMGCIFKDELEPQPG